MAHSRVAVEYTSLYFCPVSNSATELYSISKRKDVLSKQYDPYTTLCKHGRVVSHLSGKVAGFLTGH